MQNTQPKFKWHNEVIAWLNGETIEWKRLSTDVWATTTLETDEDVLPCFFISYEYRIKPKEVIEYAGIYDNGNNESEMSELFTNSIEETIRHAEFLGLNISKTKFQKRTYLNGELIALELVKV